jgi:hypothetical protein
VTFELPRSLYGYAECRLVLLLDEMAANLAAHDVVAVIVNNVYRPASTLAAKPAPKPNPTRKSAPATKSKTSKPKKTGEKKQAPQPVRLSQHALGLALDIAGFRLADGRVLNVERDWHGVMGQAPCGPQSRVLDDHPAGITLRNLTCSIASAGYCNHLITPNRDEAHANHLHCDIEAGANEILVE